MRCQPVNVRHCMAALNHFDAESFLQLALPILIRTRVHAWPTAGKRNRGNAIAWTKTARFDHARGQWSADKKTQPIMAVVAKIGAARSALPPITAEERAFSRSMPLVKRRQATS